MRLRLTFVGVIGGSGISFAERFSLVRRHHVETEFGVPSTEIQEFEEEGLRFFFLARHGNPHRIPPHLVNYRANLKALSSLGVNVIIAINAVGAISMSISTGQLVIPDQVIDYTWGREHTIDVGGEKDLLHINFTEPFDKEVRNKLIQIAKKTKLDIVAKSVVGVTQGPRLESAAEIQRLKRDGCDIVGMTSMPEAAIARELNLRYASISIVSNIAAGIGEEHASIEEIKAAVTNQSKTVHSLIVQYLENSN